MSAAILNQGKTQIRDVLKALVTHVGVSDDAAPFDATQNKLNPTAATTALIKAATKTDVTVSSSNDAFDAAITIDGNTEFTNKSIYTIGILSGAANTTAISRAVRILPIGVQAGDNYTIAVRTKVEDNS